MIFTLISHTIKMARRVILVSTMPCEVGAGALYHCLDEKALVFMMKIPEARDFNATIKVLAQEVKDFSSEIVMIGTYWADCLEQLVAHYFESKFRIYCPGKPLDLKFKTDKVTFVSGETGVGPSRFLFELAKETCQSTLLPKLFEKNYSSVMTFIDHRFVNHNIMENQPFYTGLFNFGDMELSLYDKFVNLFRGEYDLSEIINSGKAIVNSQVLMAKERALKNSRLEKLSDGTVAAVTEGPELVNLTHDAIHEKYPEAKVTLVVGIKFGPSREEDELSYSIRSFDMSVNAQSLAKKVGGDGSCNTAGGRIKIELPTPF
jgi:hypothetical protein